MSSNDRSDKRFEKLKRLRKNVKWEIKEERSKFFYNLMKNWQVLLPDLWNIFRKEEIDSLLSDSICYVNDEDSDIVERGGKVFVKFVVHVGYKDEPKVDEDCKPHLQRAAKYEFFIEDDVIRELFKIYGGFDTNKCLVSKTADTPQHLALKYNKEKASDLLQRRGTGLNSSNEEGSTPLLTICTRSKNNNTVQIYVQDKGKITQQLNFAVTHILPDVVIMLLNIGADLSSFVFPTPTHFVMSINAQPNECYAKFGLRLASGSLIIVENLQKRGYELDRNEALTIMHLFANYKLFERSADVENNWYDNEEFAREAKEMMINPSQSLYDLIQLRPEEASKILSYEGYFQLECVDKLWLLPGSLGRACVRHLCEKLSRKFFRGWALNPIWELIHYRMPILCCNMIVENLENEDLYNICLAAQDQSREDGGDNSTTNVVIRNNTRPARAKKARKEL